VRNTSKIKTPAENDAAIGAAALERDSPLITGDRALYAPTLKVRDAEAARFFNTGRS
jgi:hypothetical protein